MMDAGGSRRGEEIRSLRENIISQGGFSENAIKVRLPCEVHKGPGALCEAYLLQRCMLQKGN